MMGDVVAWAGSSGPAVHVAGYARELTRRAYADGR